MSSSKEIEKFMLVKYPKFKLVSKSKDIIRYEAQFTEAETNPGLFIIVSVLLIFGGLCSFGITTLIGLILLVVGIAKKDEYYIVFSINEDEIIISSNYKSDKVRRLWSEYTSTQPKK